MKKIILILFTLISFGCFSQAVISDTTNYKPAVFRNGRLYKSSYWPASNTNAVTTMAAVGSSANANGASISGSTLTLQPASASFPGVVTTAAQSFAGQKLFGGGIQIQGGITSPVGSGLEMFYGSSTGTIQVYNRTGSAYLALNLSGLTTNLQASGTTILEANAAGARIPAGKYLNFGATANSSGYGFRDNSGVMEKKNSGGSWEPLASTNSLIAEAVTVTSSTSYAVTDTDLNIIYEGATGATMTLPTGTSGRVLYISNATGNTLNVSVNLYIDGTNNTLSIAPNTTVKIVYSTSASKWFRMFQN